MHKSVFFLTVILLLNACSGGDGTSIDDRERSVSWKSEITLDLLVVEDTNGMHRVDVTSYTSELPFNDLMMQLFDMAFAGSNDLFAPTLFGELDEERKLNPKELVDELQFLDSVRIEDVYTGEWRDTVIDLSFTKNNATAMVWQCSISEQDGIWIVPAVVGMGNQVFNEATGQRRGVNMKFFLRNNAQADVAEYTDQLVFYSDSTGSFFPSAFAIHEEVSSKALDTWLADRFNGVSRFRLNCTLSLNALDGILRMDDVRITSLEGERLALTF